MRVGYAPSKGRLPSGRAEVTWVILLFRGSKSNSSVGKLKMPPQLIASPLFVAVALLLIVTWLGESTLTIYEPPGISFPVTGQKTCRMAVEGMPVITGEPAVMLPEEVNPEAPASAAKMTWPLGKMAAGPSSDPKGEGIPFSVPVVSGPASHVFVSGL